MKKYGALVALVTAAALLVALMGSVTGQTESDPVAAPTTEPMAGGAFATAPPAAGRRLGRVVDGVRFSFRLYGCCWESGPVARVPNLSGFRDRRLFISKSTAGPQGAEAILFWTSFPNAVNTDACAGPSQ